ncbi:hypothetical protein E8E14_004229 [Neopestalotiopsis sp. 37M]|nr:hypothetical protein E8E14_004229 [Neopestalotiopsis sp. 37M]
MAGNIEPMVWSNSAISSAKRNNQAEPQVWSNSAITSAKRNEQPEPQVWSNSAITSAKRDDENYAISVSGIANATLVITRV